MHPISQLRSMRNAAEKRLENNSDYRLMVSLDELIVDLEEVGKLELQDNEQSQTWVNPQLQVVNDREQEMIDDVDETFDHLAAENAYGDADEKGEDPAVPLGSFG